MPMKNKRRLVVGFTYNLMPNPHGKGKENDYPEWDSPETIESVIKALEKPGSKVIPLEARKDSRCDVYHELDRLKNELDIVFNIAEGYKTPNRESLVPAMLEWLHIPFTGSDLGALAKALNKADTIEILRNYGINIAPYFVFTSADKPDIKTYITRLGRVFPLIVKPVGEGTSTGLNKDSVVENIEQLSRSIKRVIEEYDQPAMVQQFLDGNEYTVGILGDCILPILEIDLKKIPEKPKIRDYDVKEIDINYSRPAKFDENYILLSAQAATAHTALSCRDYNRMDFRKHSDGKIYFLEANPLPGLNPDSSDFPKMCKLAGIDYDVMINGILYEAIKGYQRSREFVDRFQEKRVRCIGEFIRETMTSLQSYPVVLPPEHPPEFMDTPYKFLKVKK
jgi:D-alanine-D-alanine ligase